MIKDDILTMIQSSKDDYVVFELIEQFADLADSYNDLTFLVNLLEHHENSIVRHEAAAQLAEIKIKKPDLFRNADELIINTLVKCAINDKSTTARHEAIEALGYIGNKTVLNTLEQLMGDKEEDIRQTAKIAADIIKFRLEKRTESSDMWKEMLQSYLKKNVKS